MAKRTKGRRLGPYLAFWLVGWLVARSVNFIFYLNVIQTLLAIGADASHRHPRVET